MEKNFINNIEKIQDMLILSKARFLKTHRNLTEEEYENTQNIILKLVVSRNKLYKTLNENSNKRSEKNEE